MHICIAPLLARGMPGSNTNTTLRQSAQEEVIMQAHTISQGGIGKNSEKWCVLAR